MKFIEIKNKLKNTDCMKSVYIHPSENILVIEWIDHTSEHVVFPGPEEAQSAYKKIRILGNQAPMKFESPKKNNSRNDKRQ